MATNYVLIDFESVQPETLAGFDDGDFKVIVFVGGLQAKVPFDIASALQRLGNKADYVKIAGSGPNALDFHIAFYIGQFAALNSGARFYIVSKDTGFDPLIHHLKARNTFTCRVRDIREVLVAAKANGNGNGSDHAKPANDPAGIVAAILANPKCCKPRSLKKLSSSIQAILKKPMAESAVLAVIADLRKRNILTVTGNQVTYPSAPASQLTMLE